VPFPLLERAGAHEGSPSSLKAGCCVRRQKRGGERLRWLSPAPTSLARERTGASISPHWVLARERREETEVVEWHEDVELVTLELVQLTSREASSVPSLAEAPLC